MLYETPDDTFNAYLKFLKKREYKKAYDCLKKLLYQFPDDVELLVNMTSFCIRDWNRPDMSIQWLKKLADITSEWETYFSLSSVEASSGHFSAAREHLAMAKKLVRKQKGGLTLVSPRKIFSDLEKSIKYGELGLKSGKPPVNLTMNKSHILDFDKKQMKKLQDSRIKTPKTVTTTIPNDHDTAYRQTASFEIQTPPQIPIPNYAIPIKIEPFKEDPSFFTSHASLNQIKSLINYEYLSMQGGYDELLCLNAVKGIEKYWYQIETVKKVLKHFRGSVLLCDEVGLGKTIEAGMLIKEYIQRGMVKNILVLTPASLVSQWKEEMQSKFGVEFITTDDPDFMKAPEDFWKQRFIIASINTAKSSRNMQLVVNQFYDLVVVDEAHHLRNRSTLSWKLVNQIKKRFIFLLTATPVQNNLIELFNLITLLKPGQFKTEKEFKKEYLSKGSLKETADKEKMRGLLRDVMIRNTRSAIDLKLPKRFAVTMRISPTNTEKEIYTGINQYLMEHDVPKTSVNLLLREAGSSLFALKESLLRMKDREGLRDIINKILDIKDISKGDALIRILQKNPAEKKIVFTHFIKSMDYIGDLLSKEGIPYVIFKGTMPLKEKDAAIAGFKNDVPVLVSTESGGEGRNLQFCNTIINFDLPWNPMRIEQRIGRLHRIGQTRDVFIFNLSVRDTIEDYIIEILDSKINMFEMVIGEIEPILGHLGEDRDFEEIILDIWAESKDNNMLKQNFERLGNDMVKAKNDYLRSKSLDNAIFGEDYET
jgi:SNF2 family DNA or RNA helicase